MVCLLADSTHKCPGTQSSHVGSEILQSDNSELSYSAVNRQYDCSSLYEQRRGGVVTNFVFHGDQSVRMVYEKTGVSDSQVCARKTKCSCRLAIQERADNQHGVDYPQGDTVSDISILGSPSLRSVCHEVEHQLPVFISPFQDPRAWAVDAMSLSWEGMIAYAFPPVPLLMKVLLKIEKETCLVILIAPSWESHPFFPVLLSLLVAPAVRIPIRKDLLIQPHSRLPHLKPEIYNLHAWLCCREVSRRQDFLRNLPRESVLQSDLPHSLCTIPAGTLGWIGVSSGRWIPSIQL